MKTIKLILLTSITFLLSSCVMDPIYSCYFVNQSNCTVYSFFNYYGLYPDTLLPPDASLDLNYPDNSGDTSVLWQDMCGIWDVFDTSSGVVDTMSIYIIDADTVALYSWDTVVKYNKVLQRYDLSLSDLEGLNIKSYYSFVYFPPTEAMKHIHMWPPYGTYDEHGRRKEKKR